MPTGRTLVTACATALLASALGGAVVVVPAAALPVGGDSVGWGANADGAIGNGGTSTATSPTATSRSGVLAGRTLVSLSAGQHHTCAVDDTGAAFCWGMNSWGQLGTGSSGNPSPVPVQVSTSGVLAGKVLVRIAAGDIATCALDSVGLAYCWGYGVDGILGNGSVPNYSSVPVAVSQGNVRFSSLSMGNRHVCAVRTDSGGVMCWGRNDGAQASGTGPVATVPRTVPALPGRSVAVAAGQSHSCAVQESGKAYCWGLNSYGQLGTGFSPIATASAVKVTDTGALAGKTLTAITASFATCALDTGGKAYCWGGNSHGQAGNGATGNLNTPTEVSTGGALSGVSLRSISTRANVTCATSTPGALYCWGENVNGVLGPNATGDYSTTPVAYPASGVLSGRLALSVSVGGWWSSVDDTDDSRVMVLATHPKPTMTLASPAPGTLRVNVGPDKPYGQQWQVKLQRKVGSQWEAAVGPGATTGPTSVRDFRYLPSGTYRAWVAAKPGFMAGYSAPFTYTAKKISATISVYSGTGLKVTVAPVLDGSAAWQVGFQRKSGSTWSSAGSCYTSGATESCSKNLPAGTYRVKIARGAGYLGYTSGAFAVPS